MCLAVSGRLSPVTGEEALERLARRVRRRRQALGLTIDDAAEEGGVSPTTWSRVELGRPVRGLTYGVVDRVLRWSEGSAEAILDGGTESLDEDPRRSPADDDLDARIDRIRRNPEARKRLRDLLVAARLGEAEEEEGAHQRSDAG
jgi:transcriptional regulator with XRE-family HTH domain